MMAKNTFLVDLTVNRSLLNSKFDGYKLSLDSLATYESKLENAIDCAKPADSQFSYQHARAFALHNHLFSDPWAKNVVYFVNEKWEIQQCSVHQESKLSSPFGVFQIPNASERRQNSERFNVSVSFPSELLAVVADGSGLLFLLHTYDRCTTSKQWKVIFKGSVLGESKPFAVTHTTAHSSGEEEHVECVLQLVDRCLVAGDTTEKFETSIEWITLLSSTVDRMAWSVSRRRCLSSTSWPDHIAVERSGTALNCVAARPMRFVSDSLQPLTDDPVATTDSEKDEPQPAYTWSQDGEHVTAMVPVPVGTAKEDVTFQLAGLHLTLALRGASEPLLCGELFAPIDSDGSTWTFADTTTITGSDQLTHVVELHLLKSEACMWSAFIPSDHRGRVILDAQQLEDLLKPFTSDSLNPKPDRDGPKPYNTQELEECDMYSEDQAVYQRFDGATHLLTHQINLGGNQWLFSVAGQGGEADSLCLRHDVDGLVWQPMEHIMPNTSPIQHVATFNAFGYVQASKSDKKFLASSPSYSYVAICETSRRAYIYYQPAALASSLRNRKTGRQVDSVAKQQVVTLNSHQSIVGCHAAADFLFILTTDTLFVINMQTS